MKKYLLLLFLIGCEKSYEPYTFTGHISITNYEYDYLKTFYCIRSEIECTVKIKFCYNFEGLDTIVYDTLKVKSGTTCGNFIWGSSDWNLIKGEICSIDIL